MRGPIRLLLSFFVLMGISLASPALAQVPSYAQPDSSGGEDIVHGRILSIPGQFTIVLRDDRGFVDTIQLNPGTVINPSGFALAPGMVVTVTGYNQGTFL